MRAGLAFLGGGAAWQPCQEQLCHWGQSSPAAEHRCFARPAYIHSRLEPGSAWAGLFAEGDRCARALETETGYFRRNGTVCEEAKCSWDPRRRLCEPSFGRTLEMVTSEVDLGAHRCGALGELSARGSVCVPYGSQEECAYVQSIAPEAGCTWLGDRCDVDPALLSELVDGLSEKIHVIRLRQGTCAGRLGSRCGRPCVYQVNSSGLYECAPSQMEMLLLLAGPSCPYVTMLQRRELCSERTRETCGLARKDGLPDCEWLGDVCMTDPVTLEQDLVDLPELREAQAICMGHADRDACLAQCAPEPYEGLAGRGVVAFALLYSLA